MKNILTLLLWISWYCLLGQVTMNPNHHSDFPGWTIEKVEVTDTETLIDLQFSSPKENYGFGFNSEFFIEDARYPDTKKFRILAFTDYELNVNYETKPNVLYNFQLRFEKIDPLIDQINVVQKLKDGTKAGWKNIELSGGGIESFVKNTAVSLLATMAHPTNEYESGSYIIKPNEVLIQINYAEGLRTVIRIERDFNFFSGIEVIEDNDFIPPFVAIGLMKSLFDEIMRDNEESNADQSRLASEFNKHYENISGTDIALIMLNYQWMGY